VCDAWNRVRRELETNVGMEVTAQNVVDIMLCSRERWRWIETAITDIMKKREDVEREQERC